MIQSASSVDFMSAALSGCVCLEPYSVREARVHVRHVRDLMCGGCEEMTQQEMYSGERGCSVSVLDHIIHESGSLSQYLLTSIPPQLVSSSYMHI